MTRREAARQLRDGVAVPASTLAGLHPELAGTLLAIATLPARQAAVAELARRTGIAIGFKQLASVRLPATGVTPWRDHAAAPHIGEQQSPGGSFQPGLAGMLAASVMLGGPMGSGGGRASGPGAMFGFGDGYGRFGGYWAFRALGAGMNSREQPPMAARPDLARGGLTPATEDLAALTAAGQNPTVLAFALGSRAGGWSTRHSTSPVRPSSTTRRSPAAAPRSTGRLMTPGSRSPPSGLRGMECWRVSRSSTSPACASRSGERQRSTG